MSASDHLGPQFDRDDVPVDGYDPEQVGPENASAKFHLEPRFSLKKIQGLEPMSGKKHDAASSINDGYYSDMSDAVKDSNVPPVVVSRYAGGEHELHDGWHRGSLALHHGITHVPAYVHDSKQEPPSWAH